jgi:hypothetical protein
MHAYIIDGGTIKKPIRAFGIMGFIRLVESYHMAIIERRRSVGRLLGHEIFALEHVSFIQVYSGKMPEDSRHHEIKYIKYLSDSNLTSPCFFSYSLDLTRTLQSNMGGSPAHAPAVTAANPSMYCWNHHLLHGGTQFTCFTSTNVQILTPEELRARGFPPEASQQAVGRCTHLWLFRAAHHPHSRQLHELSDAHFSRAPLPPFRGHALP